MTDDARPSLASRFLGAILFCSLSVASIIWFLSSTISLVSEIRNSSMVLTFNKGAMYMLGVSIGTFFLSIGVTYHSLFSRKVPEKLEKILMKGVIAGIIIMFLIPQIVHLGVSKVIHKRQYVDCHQAEYSWLLYKKYVFTKNDNICQQLEKEITKNSNGR